MKNTAGNELKVRTQFTAKQIEMLEDAVYEYCGQVFAIASKPVPPEWESLKQDLRDAKQRIKTRGNRIFRTRTVIL